MDWTISIHSLRMEGDIIFCYRSIDRSNFNPLPPHGGRLPHSFTIPASIHISIHSLRMEGDKIHFMLPLPGYHFNPLPPHGGRPMFCNSSMEYVLFQSTPSAWRETCTLHQCDLTTHISIHSLRMEGDKSNYTAAREAGYFNPLPPHGGRRRLLIVFTTLFKFQSTPSAWRETGILTHRESDNEFQSTPSAWRET